MAAHDNVQPWDGRLQGPAVFILIFQDVGSFHTTWQTPCYIGWQVHFIPTNLIPGGKRNEEVNPFDLNGGGFGSCFGDSGSGRQWGRRPV